MAKASEIEKVILDTLEEAANTGFEADRVQSILNQTELSLKKQKDDFGWKLILSLTPGWNHAPDPLTLLKINDILDRFKEDIKDPGFLQQKIRQHFLENNHRLTLTMSPESDFLEKQQKVLDELEFGLVKNLSDKERQLAIEQGESLEQMQSAKDSLEKMSCLPTLSLKDISHHLPKYGGVSSASLSDGIKGQVSAQPTNEVAYVKFRLNTEYVLNDQEKEILPLFTKVMASMGAGDKSYRDMDLAMELHTGGIGGSIHLAEDPENASELIQKGIMVIH